MKNTLIIGANQGIGLNLAQRLHAHSKLLTVSRHLGPELEALSTQHLMADATIDSLSNFPNFPSELHGLVYCPGSIRLKNFSRLSEEDFLADFRQNVLGAVKVLQTFLPQLVAAKGASVVLFSTVAVAKGMPFHASIAASKGAVEGLAKSLAAEWARQHIRVNVIAPSLTQTPLAESLLNTPEKVEAAAKRHPLGRVGTPADVASLAEFLLSESSSWMTGQVLGVDGGLSSLG